MPAGKGVGLLMFGVPRERPVDWNFRLLGFPVRVSLFFWLMAVMLGPREPRGAVLWVVCMFVSILIHEFGHGLAARWFGFRSKIMLYELGGLCVSESEEQSSNQRILILLAGPGAQFLLLGLVVLCGWLFLGLSLTENWTIAKVFLGLPIGVHETISNNGSVEALELYGYLFQINLFWPLLNLLPIWPLDGGQIACEVFAKVNRREGRRWGHILSMVTAGILAIYTLANDHNDSPFKLLRVLFFAAFAFANFQILQTYHHNRQLYGSDRDPDW